MTLPDYELCGCGARGAGVVHDVEWHRLHDHMPSQPQAPQPDLSAEATGRLAELIHHDYGCDRNPIEDGHCSCGATWQRARALALIRSELSRATWEQAEEIARLRDGDELRDRYVRGIESERDEMSRDLSALRAELERWQRGHVPCSICRGFDCKGHPCE